MTPSERKALVHRFVLQVLEREFESGDLKPAKRNLVRSADPARQSEAILRADVPKVTRRLMDILDINASILGQDILVHGSVPFAKRFV